jgi:hypothetical protein
MTKGSHGATRPLGHIGRLIVNPGMNNTERCSTRSPKPKTSLDILRERDALATELREAHATIERIREEAEHALRHPEISFLALCRIAARVRRNAE